MANICYKELLCQRSKIKDRPETMPETKTCTGPNKKTVGKKGKIRRISYSKKIQTLKER